MTRLTSALLLAALAAPARAAKAPPPPDPVLTYAARAVRPGEILLVSVSGHDAKQPPSASFRGASLEFFPGPSTGTWLAFAGLDLETSTGPAPLRATLRAPGGQPVIKTETLLVEPATFPTVELKVEQKYVTPPRSDAERAEGEASKLQRLFAYGAEKRLFEGRFESPIPGAATARFGERRVFNGVPRAPHSGMDLKARLGTPVKAPESGRVVLADELFYQGKTVVLDHGAGLTTLYAHLSKLLVRTGDAVKKGQVIGEVGATGRVTGPHLHWAMKHKGARVDPYSLAAVDLDAWLKPKAPDPLKRSAACDDKEPPPGRWSRASGGLRARARAAKPAYIPGEPLTFVVELQNTAKKAAFIDFVRDSALRPWTVGISTSARPFELLASSRAAAAPYTEQVKIPRGASLCFEQAHGPEGALLADSTSYSLSYSTEWLYPSTSTTRAVWRGRLALPPVPVTLAPGD